MLDRFRRVIFACLSKNCVDLIINKRAHYEFRLIYIYICAVTWASNVCAQRRLKSACACAQSDQSSLSAGRHLITLAIQNVPSEDSDQTLRMRRLI